ncbi:MAG: FlxA-like family protein [Bacillus sp. (in: Bacteria)]|nr:FlxA-like family protein [Bacillus sp. (in: firmicutes)]MCM1425163.1 FlxA-like family protein [Eubacterium sp.]
MTINGISGAGAGMSAGQAGMPQGMDPVSKDIQNQISRLQKQLQELSANTEMSGEAKMKKRQELQKQINDLNVQLRQHQVEMRKKEREEKESFDDMLGAKPQDTDANGKGQGMPSQAGMEAMISAGVTMEQAKVHGSVAAKMEGHAGVLKAEIALDGSRGGDTTAKQAELADVEEKAMNATASQMDALSKASETMKEAGETSGENKTAKEDKESGISKTDEEKNGESVDGETVVKSKQDNVEQADAADAASVIAPVRQYTPVDVRL